MISFIIINLILPILLGILSSWVYDSIKDMRYQNAILLIMESREVRLSYFSEFSHYLNFLFPLQDCFTSCFYSVSYYLQIHTSCAMTLSEGIVI